LQWVKTIGRTMQAYAATTEGKLRSVVPKHQIQSLSRLSTSSGASSNNGSTTRSSSTSQRLTNVHFRVVKTHKLAGEYQLYILEDKAWLLVLYGDRDATRDVRHKIQSYHMQFH